jgi:hypothetical protein
MFRLVLCPTPRRAARPDRREALRLTDAVLACIVLVLAGCGGVAWVKPGASPETAKAELADCESEARAATRHDRAIDSDILASRGNDWQRAGTLGTNQAQMGQSLQARSDQITARCMSAKGFRPSP